MLCAVKHFVLILQFSTCCLTCFGQYIGGAGQGLAGINAVSLNLNSSTVFSGGGRHGNAFTAINGQALATTSSYSGGPDDGFGFSPASGIPLSSISMFTGGANDGNDFLQSNNIPLNAIGAYTGGTDDGFGQIAANAQLLNATSIYAGGTDDGFGNYLASTLSMGTATMYAGGANDGFDAISSSARSLNSQTVFSGGSDDGFSFVFRPAISIALPLQVLEFSATRHGVDAFLNWKIINTMALIGFEVERSYDGINFNGIGYKIAATDTANMIEYQFTDSDPARYCGSVNCSDVFYRLKLFDISQHINYSPARKLSLINAATSVTVYPNPASEKVVIAVHCPDGHSPSFSISILNSMGTVVMRKSTTHATSVELDLRVLPAGIYQLHLNIDGQTESYAYKISITH